MCSPTWSIGNLPEMCLGRRGQWFVWPRLISQNPHFYYFLHQSDAPPPSNDNPPSSVDKLISQNPHSLISFSTNLMPPQMTPCHEWPPKKIKFFLPPATLPRRDFALFFGPPPKMTPPKICGGLWASRMSFKGEGYRGWGRFNQFKRT